MVLVNATSNYPAVGIGRCPSDILYYVAASVLNLNPAPTYGYICDASVTPCAPTTTTINAAVFNGYTYQVTYFEVLTYQYVADRSACGKTVMFSTKVNDYGGQGATNSLNHSIVVGTLDTATLTGSLPAPPTTGGNVTFAGVFLPHTNGQTIF